MSTLLKILRLVSLEGGGIILTGAALLCISLVKRIESHEIFIELNYVEQDSSHGAQCEY